MNIIRKNILSVLAIFTFASYFFYTNSIKTVQITTENTKVIPIQTTPVAPAIVQTPSKVAVGKYKDGTYTGDITDAYYGDMQVQVVVASGNITTVNILQYPSDRNTSVRINNRALPILKQETIIAQSAEINAVSGASYSSPAFKESLTSALAQAKN